MKDRVYTNNAASGGEELAKPGDGISDVVVNGIESSKVLQVKVNPIQRVLVGPIRNLKYSEI